MEVSRIWHDFRLFKGSFAPSCSLSWLFRSIEMRGFDGLLHLGVTLFTFFRLREESFPLIARALILPHLTKIQRELVKILLLILRILVFLVILVIKFLVRFFLDFCGQGFVESEISCCHCNIIREIWLFKFIKVLCWQFLLKFNWRKEAFTCALLKHWWLRCEVWMSQRT